LEEKFAGGTFLESLRTKIKKMGLILFHGSLQTKVKDLTMQFMAALSSLSHGMADNNPMELCDGLAVCRRSN
jgi:hypothetical protein